MFKAIFAVLFICVNGYAANTEQRFFDNTGGLVDRFSPLLISEKNATEISNVTLDDRGVLSKRNGQDLVVSTGALTRQPVLGGGYHDTASGTDFFGVVVGTNVFRTSNSFGGTFTNVTSTVVVTNAATNLIQTTSFRDQLIFCSESNPPFKLGAATNAVIISSAPAIMKTCATYGNYLVGANTTESSVAYPSRVRWSDINNPDLWPTNNYIDVEPDDGDRITAVIAFEDSVYIFKKRSIYRMLITGEEGAFAFIVRPVARDIGAWSKMSVKVLNNTGIMFQAQNGIYQFDGESFQPISDPIQRTIDTVSRTQWASTVAAVYPKRNQYWIAIATSTSQNTQVLAYDYVQKAWTTYSGMSVNMLAQAEDSVGNNLLISGDYLGNIYKQDTGTTDQLDGVNTAIAASYVTPHLTFGSASVHKAFKYLYIFTVIDSSATLSISAGYDFSSAYEFNTTVDLGQAGALYDTAIYDTDVYPSIQYKVSRIELNRSARDLKLKFLNQGSDSALGVIGWAVVYSVEDWRQ